MFYILLIAQPGNHDANPSFLLNVTPGGLGSLASSFVTFSPRRLAAR